jgi:hypothetical protein
MDFCSPSVAKTHAKPSLCSGRKIISTRCYIDLKIGGTIFSAAWICFNDFGFLSWVP